MRNLYFSGVCNALKDRLEKLRFTEVISYMNNESDMTSKSPGGNKMMQDKKKSTMMNVNAPAIGYRPYR